MKQKLFLLLFSLILITSIKSQSITPVVSSEQCPLTDIIFTVSVPGTSPVVSSLSAIGTAPIVVINAYNATTTNGITTFNFKGKFTDVNATQAFRVSYVNALGNSVNYDPPFTKIKSLFTYNSANLPTKPSPATINAPACQSQNIAVNFTKAQWVNAGTSAVFGVIDSYEYSLPAGWRLNGGTPSTGFSDWKAGTNSATITTDLLNGSGGTSVQVRAVNNCGTNLYKGGQPLVIPINRPGPVLKIGGSTDLTLYCGDVSAKTFTIDNASQFTCITNYNWQVGNKGWFDANGNAITANITTTAPSITLYPSCTAANPAKDVEVIMNAGATQFSSKVTVTFSNTPPKVAISGPAEFCTSGTYSVAVSPSCGAIVTWSLEPLANYPTPVSLSNTSGQSVTLTKINGGTALLKATVNFPNCNSTGVYTKYIGVGLPVFRGWYNSPTNAVQPMVPFFRNDISNPVCYGTQITTSTDITANSKVEWDGTANSPSIGNWYQQGNNLKFYFYNVNQTAIFRVYMTNSCGTTSLGYRFNSTNAVCSGGPLLKLAVAPNPISNTVNISLTDRTAKAKQKEIVELRIIDKMGNVKQKWNYTKGSSITQIRQLYIGSLPADIYTIMAFDGNTWTVEKIIKK
jgi:hypothetical protein